MSLQGLLTFAVHDDGCKQWPGAGRGHRRCRTVEVRMMMMMMMMMMMIVLIIISVIIIVVIIISMM